MSCHGIDPDLYVTETRVDDVEIKEYIVNNCEETYLLVDNSKLPRQGVVKVSDIADYDTIITDNNAEGMFISRLNSHGCKIDIVPIEN
jgi:DeoR/GlpR family transcriptional regulator of sugar metabolism